MSKPIANASTLDQVGNHRTGENTMKPSDFLKHPYDSVLQHTEDEIVARNIMVILNRTGNEFR